MANGTIPTEQDPRDFLVGVEPERRRLDGEILLHLMEEATGQKAVMWGASLVGFGSYDYRYPSGHSGTMFRVGFAPRKTAVTLYGLNDHADAGETFADLGPHTGGAGCLYVKRLDAIDLDVLALLVRRAFERRKESEV
jgi:hypothetical protein